VLGVQAADRPIYYPAKLPPTEAALMEALLQKLQGLQQMLDDHMVRAVKQLRTQVMDQQFGAVVLQHSRLRFWKPRLWNSGCSSPNEPSNMHMQHHISQVTRNRFT
jgi:hypothetical protein